MNKALGMLLVVAAAFLILTTIINACGARIQLSDCLPFVPGHSGLFSLCALAAIAIVLWGIGRIFNGEDD